MEHPPILRTFLLLTIENLNKAEEAASPEPLEILDAKRAEILTGMGEML
jgi:hypothetical protein